MPGQVPSPPPAGPSLATPALDFSLPRCLWLPLTGTNPDKHVGAHVLCQSLTCKSVS